jgi:ABC-type transport system involved in multi-copper enzyme maturation permease subunit
MIGVIAANTFYEAMRDRIWMILIIFGFTLLVSQFAFTPIALGEGPRVTIDLGLATLNLLGLMVAVVVGGNLVHQEIDRRSVHIILARPVGRTVYLIGKWLGLNGMLWGTGVLMGAGLLAVGWHIRGSGAVLPIVQAVILTCLSFSILCSLAVFFSSISTPLLSSVYTLGVYGLGWWALDLRHLASTLGEPLQTALLSVSYALPNLEIFNSRYAVAHLESLPTVQIVIAMVYALLYSAAVLALAAIAFQAREFK